MPFSKFSKNFFHLCSPIWCGHPVQILAILTKIEGSDTFGVNYLNILPKSQTFETNRILTFCKKPLFPLMHEDLLNKSKMEFFIQTPYHLKMSIWNFQDQFLTSILMILQIFVKWPCPELAFPENRLFVHFITLLTRDLQTKTIVSNHFLISCLPIELNTS